MSNLLEIDFPLRCFPRSILNFDLPSHKLKSVVLVGAGGFGREILELLKALNDRVKHLNILGWIDENELLHGKIINDYPVLGGLDWFEEHNDVGCVVTIADCKARKLVVERLKKIGVTFYNAIHTSAIIGDFVELGEGVIIQAGCILTTNIKVGNHVHFNTNVTIGHDAVIGDYCTLGPKVDVNGYDRLGEGVYIGCHGVILQEISIGSWSTIGAGAVAIKDIPENVTAVGVPAKVI